MPKRKSTGPQQIDAFPSYRGGRTCLYGKYVYEFLPEHPLANQWGWVAQHRVVGEDIVGRPLVQSDDWDKSEVVHHRDECETNNDPSNLLVMTRRQHTKLHARLRAERQKARINADSVKQALRGRTIKQAAKLLGCDSQTIRNRFPSLIEGHLRARPNRAEHTSTLEKIRPYANDPKMTLAKTSEILHIAERTITKCCRLHGLPWVHAYRSGRPPSTTPKASGTHASLTESASPR